MSAAGELAPYLVLILVGFLPTEIWRMLGLAVARGVDEESELVVWIRAIAIAVLAGVIAKLTLFPPGAFITRMPRALAASRSTLSMPVPARAITRSFGAFAINAASTLVALRTTRASALASAGARTSGVRPDLASTVQPGTADSRSTADAGN